LFSFWLRRAPRCRESARAITAARGGLRQLEQQPWQRADDNIRYRTIA
jgi:hypothetical protein